MQNGRIRLSLYYGALMKTMRETGNEAGDYLTFVKA